MSKKLAELRKMVGDTPLTGAISMAYLDEGGALRRVELSIDGDEPTTDDWARLGEKAEVESFRAFEVLSMGGGTVIIPDGSVVAGTPDDNTLLEALTLAECGRDYRRSAR